ncbi:Hypothetical protein CINCED_3A012093 [Cinara cedri]|uniref:Uncharacterized protein n=1 Tax=Cinara cedri TaxID=506608 RepID=A0A5E4NCP4_9HEMI|nr:Hypothetical protein CINCED_3A012093 [Cinara cedri]
MRERLEGEIALASNTKVSIKEAAKELGLSFRELFRTAKAIGMVWSPDGASQKIMKLKEHQTKFQAKTEQAQREQSAQLEEIRRVVVGKELAAGSEVEDPGRGGDILRAISSIGEELKAQRVAISRLVPKNQWGKSRGGTGAGSTRLRWRSSRGDGGGFLDGCRSQKQARRPCGKSDGNSRPGSGPEADIPGATRGRRGEG